MYLDVINDLATVRSSPALARWIDRRRWTTTRTAKRSWSGPAPRARWQGPRLCTALRDGSTPRSRRSRWVQHPDHPPDPDDPFGPSCADHVPTHLSPEILDDDPSEVIASWVADDPDAAERQRLIDTQLAVVCDLADEHVWDLVLETVSSIQQRHDNLLVIIAQRAFQDGRAFEAAGAANEDGVPLLTGAILLDPQALHSAIDDVLHGDPELRDLRHRIVRAQDRLQRRLDSNTWRLVLAVEELTTCASVVAQELLVRWAYRSGVRARPRSAQ